MIRRVLLAAAVGAGLAWSQTHRFRLLRLRDISGTSGTGVVAVGVELPLKLGALMRWRTPTWSVTWYPRMEWVEAIHGHQGATVVDRYEPYQWGGEGPSGHGP